MTRCITRVSTWCSTNSGVRVSAKQPANRSVSRIARSVWPSSRAPASEVIAPPSKLATTARPATGGNSTNAGLQSVGIGASYGFEKICDRNTILSESAPQCTRFGEKAGLARARQLPAKFDPRLVKLLEKVLDLRADLCLHHIQHVDLVIHRPLVNERTQHILRVEQLRIVLLLTHEHLLHR